MNFLSVANLTRFNVSSLYSSALIRSFGTTSVRLCEVSENQEEGAEKRIEKIDPAIDRTRVIPVETSIRYLGSSAYKQTYGEQPVWVPYRRNFKGPFPPRKTRKTCIRHGKISTGNPCPICRDEYLVLDHNNTELLKQFISQQSGKVINQLDQ
jgi:small subunit ribosomal protein S18b